MSKFGSMCITFAFNLGRVEVIPSRGKENNLEADKHLYYTKANSQEDMANVVNLMMTF